MHDKIQVSRQKSQERQNKLERRRKRGPRSRGYVFTFSRHVLGISQQNHGNFDENVVLERECETHIRLCFTLGVALWHQNYQNKTLLVLLVEIGFLTREGNREGVEQNLKRRSFAIICSILSLVETLPNFLCFTGPHNWHFFKVNTTVFVGCLRNTSSTQLLRVGETKNICLVVCSFALLI